MIPLCCPSVADREDHQNVIARVAAPPRVADERGAGMPRRRRGLDRMMAQRRAQRDAPEIGENNFHSVKSIMGTFLHLSGVFCVFLFFLIFK